MTENELDALRRANPVDRHAVDELVARHQSAFGEAIGAAPQAHRRSGLFLTNVSDGKQTRFNPLAIAAVTIATLALPAMLFATIGLDNGVETPDPNLPQLDELPQPDDLQQGDDELFVPAPTADSIAPPTTIITATTTAPTRATTPPTTTTQQPEAVADADPSASEVSSPPPSDGETSANLPIPEIAPSTTVTPTVTPSPTTTAPALTPSATTTTTTIAPDTGTTNEPPAPNAANQPFDPTRDLLVVTLDFSNDDDHHAAVASREIASTLGVEPLVVAGTQSVESTVYVFDYAPVMSAAWGTGWIDAAVDRSGATSDAADRWLSTIDAGGVVRVAEGGVSDFTAEVLREVQQRRPALNTTSVVQVVHHIERNVNFTRDGDIDLLQQFTSYRRIDDGNNANGTADLEQEGPLFESSALAGPYRDAWTVAFDQRDASRLDFSDTVTVLDIVGVDVATVADPDDFATSFMP